MMFFFKPKTLVVDVFTHRPELLEYSKIDYAHKFIPDWWKGMPKTYRDPHQLGPASTIKACDGFIENYKRGFMIPMWCDFMFKTDEYGNASWAFSDRKTTATPHPRIQYEKFLPDSKYHHIKIESPWFIKTKEEVYFQWSEPIWNFNTNDTSEFIVPPAVVDFHYQHGNNINLFIKTDVKEEFLFPHGQPMAHLMPLTERKIVLKHHLLSYDEYNKFNAKQSLITFTGKYKKVKKILRAKEKESKCPFGFGK